MADTIRAIIETHRAALAACDSEDNPGGPLNTAERQAWKAFVAAPCAAEADVKAKVSYLTGSERLTDWMEDNQNDPFGFLRSLRLPAPPADPFVERMHRYQVEIKAYLANPHPSDDDVEPSGPLCEELENGSLKIGSIAGAAMALRQAMSLEAIIDRGGADPHREDARISRREGMMAALFARKECAGSCSPDRASANRRAAIERQIEALIDQLDAMDGDADAEDDGTAEPSLGWSLTQAHGTGGDREGTSPEWGGPSIQRRRTR